MKYILTCTPGVEDIVAAEVAEKLEAHVHGPFRDLGGRVLIETELSHEQLYAVRSIYHIIQLTAEFQVQQSAAGLTDIYHHMRQVDIPAMKDASTFRVTSMRQGDHAFTSIAVQQAAGRALDEKYSAAVDLETYDVEVRCDVVANQCYVGIQLTDTSLHRRYEKPFHHPAAIKAPLAYCLLRLAQLEEGDRLLDPLCGSGTIAIEAAQAYDTITVFASDINTEFVEGARENVKTAEVAKTVTVQQADAQALNQEYSGIDAIVTNPPYGLKSGKRINLHQLFFHFLQSADAVVTTDGVVVCIALPARSFRDAAEKVAGWEIQQELPVDIGGLTPKIFLLQRPTHQHER